MSGLYRLQHNPIKGLLSKMHTITLLLIILTVITIIIFVLLKNAIKHNITWPFYAKKILSQPEQVLYFRLVESFPAQIILAQVQLQLSQLLGIKKGYNHQAWLNRINRMSVDFVFCNKDTSIIAVIEFDDATHLRKARRIADTKKDKALSASGIKIIRWQVKAIPNVAEIQSSLLIQKDHIKKISI